MFNLFSKNKSQLNVDVLPKLEEGFNETPGYNSSCIESTLINSEHSEETCELVKHSNLLPMPHVFCRDYLIKRENLFPSKAEISDFFIENVLAEKPFSLILLDSYLDYYQLGTWAKLYKDKILDDVNANLRENKGAFIHLPISNMQGLYEGGLILNFDLTAVRILRDRILSILKKMHLLDVDDQEVSLKGYYEFMSGMPKVSFDLSDIPFKIHHISSSLWGNISAVTKLEFIKDFSALELELMGLTDDAVTSVNQSQQDQKFYCSISLKGKLQETSHIFVDIHALLKEYNRNIELIAE